MENGIGYIKYAHRCTGWDKNWVDGTKIEIFDQIKDESAKIQISFRLHPRKIKINIKY